MENSKLKVSQIPTRLLLATFGVISFALLTLSLNRDASVEATEPKDGPQQAAETASETPAGQATSDFTDADRHFAIKVLPLFKEKCFGCHGTDPDDLRGDFDMRSRDMMLHGGESGEPSMVPGDADDSEIMMSIRWESNEMPPKENDRLTEEQIADVESWVNAGAPWPGEELRKQILLAERDVIENEEGRLVSTSGGLSDEWTFRRYRPQEIWAFAPLQRPETEDATDSAAIDFFINRQLQKLDVDTASMADPQTLVRRAYFDLIGLPPTPGQVDAFMADWKQDSDAAWSGLIDELLASPHYGERWAQHWLDVVRYADTGGMSNDYERSNAWRYRDYVVRAFNSDKPYDQFVIEQIAGDDLAKQDDASESASDLKDIERKIATGFLRMGPWDTAMIPQDEARQIYRDDLVHSVGQSFLSMPMRCCKCHDHKFDPIPTQDYYRMYSALSATQPAEQTVDFLPSENRNNFDQGREVTQKLYDFAKKRVDELVAKREAAAKQWYKENDKEYKDLNARKDDPDDEKPARHCGLTEEEQGQLKVREQDVWIWNRRLERYKPMVQGVFSGPDQWQNARKLREPEKQPEAKKNWKPENFIFLGGDYNATGDAVTPGVLSGCGLPVDGAPSDDPFALPTSVKDRRLALAKWIADPRNPPTARSYVNRLWQHHFGAGLVRTPNNFGVKGDAPSHPELLDWLASEFIDGGMTTKRMHRLIMLSDAYKRSTVPADPAHVETVDADNRYLSYFNTRRLTAEEIRDTMLAASGELNPELGGLPAMPEINMEVALEPRMIQFSLAPAYQASPTPQQRNRRSIYAYRVRGQADPFLEVMNKPGPNDSCDLRDDAAVSPQAFTLLNSEVVSDRSIALAMRLQQEADSTAKQIDLAYRLVLGRPATENESQRLQIYIKEMQGYHQNAQPEETVYLTEITRSLVEEFSGKPFEYTEWLPNFEKYIADKKASDVDADTRALADFCLLLFNTNEFLYVY